MATAASPDGDYEFDLFCIGAGSGGVRCSRMSSGFGAKVAVRALRVCSVPAAPSGRAQRQANVRAPKALKR